VTHAHEAVQPGSDRMTKHEVDCPVKRRIRHSEATCTLAALVLLLTEWWEVQKGHIKGCSQACRQNMWEGRHLPHVSSTAINIVFFTLFVTIAWPTPYEGRSYIKFTSPVQIYVA
jgi:hypothetical protein